MLGLGRRKTVAIQSQEVSKASIERCLAVDGLKIPKQIKITRKRF